MTTETPATTVAAALAAVGRWRADEDSRRIAELGEVAQEIKSLEAAVENLRQQLDALNTFRAELESKGEDLEALSTQRAYQAVFEVLQVQAAATAQREQELQASRQKQLADLPARMAEAQLGEVLSEVEQFKATTEPNLHLLPASYRSAMVDVHAGHLAQLRSAVMAALANPGELAADPINIDLVYAIDVVDGEPELIVVVAPVADTVQSDWIEREDGLQGWIASRIAQALYQASAEVGFVAAQALSGGHMSLLAVELELIGASPDIAEALRRHLGQLAGAPELASAKVAVSVREVTMDQLLPPEDEEGGDVE